MYCQLQVYLLEWLSLLQQSHFSSTYPDQLPHHCLSLLPIFQLIHYLNLQDFLKKLLLVILINLDYYFQQRLQLSFLVHLPIQGLLQKPLHQWLQRLHPLQIYECHIFVFYQNSSDSSFYLSIPQKIKRFLFVLKFLLPIIGKHKKVINKREFLSFSLSTFS